MEIKLIFWILICHFIADFLLQTDWQAKNKSSNFEALASHVTVYSFTIAILSIPFISELWQFMALLTLT